MRRTLVILLTIFILAGSFVACKENTNEDNSKAVTTTKIPEPDAPDPYVAVLITVADELPSCVPVEEDKFYGYDSDGKLWRIYSNDTSKLNSGDVYEIKIKSSKELTYPDGDSSGWTPQLEAYAIEMILKYSREFVFSEAVYWTSLLIFDGEPEDDREITASPDDLQIKELVKILDKQMWFSEKQAENNRTYWLNVCRYLISEKDNCIPGDVNDLVSLVYEFDFETGAVTMDYYLISSGGHERYCVLNEKDLQAVKDIFKYYIEIEEQPKL